MTYRRNLLLLPLFLLLAGSPALAQETPTTDMVDMEQEFLPQLGQFAIDYWVPRLNSYKVGIDRSLPASELASLNVMRIQWGMLVEQELQQTIPPKRSEHSGEIHSTHRETTTNLGNAEAAPVSPVPPAEQATASATASARVGATVPPAPEQAEPVYSSDRQAEELFASTQKIAVRHRAEMDALHGVITRDLNEFIEKGVELIDNFLEKNASRMERSDLESWPEYRAMMFSPEGRVEILAEFDKLYRSHGESFVMLYNGEDIFRLLGMAIPASAPLSGMQSEQSSMLAQNAPNPAGSSTRISYTLREPSSRTSIEIFDAAGTRMLMLDQGARPSGEHSTEVDLSRLSPGSYLYRLTVQVAQGEQVSSRVMQIVR